MRSAVAVYFLHETFADVYIKRELITKTLYLFTCLSSFLSLISTSYSTPILIETLNKIDETDRALDMPPYDHWIVISGIVLTIASALVIIFYTIKFLTDNPISVITEYFSFAQPFIILTLMLILFNILVLIVRERFQRINDLIKEYDTDITLYNNQKTTQKPNQKEFLNTMTNLHYNLCECAEMLNSIYNISLFFCVHIVYGEIIYAAYALKYPYQTIIKDVHFILFAMVFTLQLISVLISTYLCEKEVSMTYLFTQYTI